MKLLIAYILAATSLLADNVSFTWRPNTESNLAGYNLYLAPSVGIVAEQSFFTSGTRITVDMPPGYIAWLTAINTAEQESDPTYPLTYNPVVVELVLQGTKDLPDWVDVSRWELFRRPDAVFNPASVNIAQVLEMTRERVGIRTPLGHFKIGVDTTVGIKFFRSYVASRPL